MNKNEICLIIGVVVLIAAIVINITIVWGVAALISAILVSILMARPDRLAAHEARVRVQQARERVAKRKWEVLRNPQHQPRPKEFL